MKAGNNSYKLKNGIKKILDLLYQHNKITTKQFNKLITTMGDNKLVIATEP